MGMHEESVEMSKRTGHSLAICKRLRARLVTPINAVLVDPGLAGARDKIDAMIRVCFGQPVANVMQQVKPVSLPKSVEKRTAPEPQAKSPPPSPKTVPQRVESKPAPKAPPPPAPKTIETSDSDNMGLTVKDNHKDVGDKS